jgi:hypothetical protein
VDRFFATLAALLAAAASPRPVLDKGDPVPAPLVVVAPARYQAALAPWFAHRSEQGYRVELLDPADLPEPTRRVDTPELLARAIAARAFPGTRPGDAARTAAPVGYVLIVGDAPGPREPADATRLVPAALYRGRAKPHTPHVFLSDNPYGLPDPRGVPRLAVGRWPVRTPEEVAVQVDKALRYEVAQKPGPQRRQLTFLATTPNYDAVLDPILERLALTVISAQVAPHWSIRAAYASPRSEFFPGPERMVEQVLDWIDDATPITLFAGHGYNKGVDVVRCAGRTYPVLNSEIAGRLRGKGPGTILWISACSCGDFGLESPERGLAEALVMNPNGPIAVVAGTDETSAYPNLLHCLGLAHDVIEQPPGTLGSAFVRFKEAAYRPGPPLLKKLLLAAEPTERPEKLPEDHQYLYNLLGDPTLPLRLPQRVAMHAEVEPSDAAGAPNDRLGFRITGRLDDWETGTARVSLCLDRLAMKEHMADPAGLRDAAARDRAYRERFAKANDKVALEREASVHGGAFELSVSLPRSLAAQVRWLQVYVYTDPTEPGGWFDAVAAQPLMLPGLERATADAAMP